MRLTIASLLAASLFIGCSTKEDIVTVQNDMKTYLIGVKYNSDKFIEDSRFMLPMFVGPGKLSEEEYALKEENGYELLFNSEGVVDNLDLLLPYASFQLDDRARALGFEDIRAMYIAIHKEVLAKDGAYISAAVDSGILISKAQLELELERMLSIMYMNYNYQGDLKPSWFMSSKGEKISFTKGDYMPYALSLLILKYKMGAFDEKE